MNLKTTAALAALVAAIAAAPAVAKQEPMLESYCAQLSARDHFNSNGQRLTTAAAIIRQDRANFHKFGKRDPGDENDSFFRSQANRARLEALIAEGQSETSALRRVVNGEPRVCVEIYSDFVNVMVE